jgi:hypothetical protein
MNERIAETLHPFFERIQNRRGLRKWMNKALVTRPELPDLLREIIRLLTDLELLYDLEGSVRMTRQRLYDLMADTRPEWVCRMPHPFPGLAAARRGEDQITAVPMVIANRLALDQATALGKMAGLLAEGPRGIWGLDHDLLKKMRKAAAQGRSVPEAPKRA